MKKFYKIVLIVTCCIGFAIVVLLLHNYTSFNVKKYTISRTTCKGNDYWYSVEWATYADGKLAFLLIQKAKHGSGIKGQNNFYIHTNYLTGEKKRIDNYVINGAIKIPNDEFVLYENYCTDLNSGTIVNKSNKDIPPAIIDLFFKAQRPNYDLTELLKFYESTNPKP